MSRFTVRFTGIMSAKSIIILLLIVVSACSCVSEKQELVSLTGVMPKEEAGLIKSVIGYDLLQKVKLGPWECYAPNENLDAMLFCTYKGRIVVNIDNSDAFRVGIPKSSEYTSFVLLTDKDKDGTFESIEYDVTTDDGEVQRVVIDEDMDGELDRFLDFKEPRLMLNIGGSWYHAKDSGRDKHGKIVYKIDINGQEKRVLWNEFPYQLVDEESESNKRLQIDAAKPRD